MELSKNHLKRASKLWRESGEMYWHYRMTESKNSYDTPSYGNEARGAWIKQSYPHSRRLPCAISSCLLASPRAENRSSLILVSALRLFSRCWVFSCMADSADIRTSVSFSFSLYFRNSCTWQKQEKESEVRKMKSHTFLFIDFFFFTLIQKILRLQCVLWAIVLNGCSSQAAQGVYLCNYTNQSNLNNYILANAFTVVSNSSTYTEITWCISQIY